LGKPYGIKLRHHWESFGEQLGNLRNSMKHDENTMGTHWEHGKKKKKPLSPTSPKKKKTEPLKSAC
jgi:Sec-independent protein translocase protein TatA